ncbi:uncharacterized protein [Cicer arietinum]|uniref:uncharacterized protein n=1 Tax=Cicer arietinum TaxID=3827 RepID=UPI003CC55409
MSKAKYIPEGGSSSRPPYFDGTYYYHWKGKMRLFLISQDNNMWSVVENGDHVIRINNADATSDEKPQAQWTVDENAKVLINSKAHLFLTCALCREEYDRVEECKNAKELWDTLRIHHEGSSHVKEARIDMGVRDFELFEMKEDETIDEMFSRLTIILNNLRSLGKLYSVQERIRKILRSLPKEWRPMVTAITEARDLTNMKLEDLVGTLRAHEPLLLADKPNKKGRVIALKTSQTESSTSKKNEDVITKENAEYPLSEDEDDLVLISRKIQRMLNRRGQNRGPPQKEKIDKSQITCYGCNNMGHYKTECPLNKRNSRKFPYKNKSMMITWDDSDESSSEQEKEEEANLCLMAKSENEKVSISDLCPNCEKLEVEFDSLLNDSYTLSQKCMFQKTQLVEIKKQNEELQKKNDEYVKIIQELQQSHFQNSEKQKILETHPPDEDTEKEILKTEVMELKNDISNFVKSTETFQKIMGSQSGIFDKAGIGFKSSQKQKFLKQVHPQINKRKPWYLDSGCSRHMTRDKHCFMSLEIKDGGSVTFGNNDKAQIKGTGTIGKNNSARIENVKYVVGLKHNLLSISQLCDSDFDVIFKPTLCEVKHSSSENLSSLNSFFPHLPVSMARIKMTVKRKKSCQEPEKNQDVYSSTESDYNEEKSKETSMNTISSSQPSKSSTPPKIVKKSSSSTPSRRSSRIMSETILPVEPAQQPPPAKSNSKTSTPKKTKPPSSKPPSSSTKISANTSLFDSDELESVYTSKWQNKSVVNGKIIDLVDIKQGGFDIEEMFEQLGWTSFFKINEPQYPRLVRAFYAASKGSKGMTNFSMVLKGVHMEINPTTLCQILDIRDEGAHCLSETWYSQCVITRTSVLQNTLIKPPKSLVASNLVPLCRILHNICVHSITPRAGSFEKVT